MSLIERLKNADLVVKGVLAVLALFPSALLFVGLVEIPPSVGRLIYLISFFFSVLAILAIVTLGNWVQKLGNGAAIAVAAISITAGVICLIFYIPYSNRHVLEIRDDQQEVVDKVLTPSSPSEAILEIVKHRRPGQPTHSEYRDAFAMADEPDDLRKQLVAETWGVMTIMLLLLIGSEVLLIAPIVALAWRLAGTVETAPAQKD
jgi:hypothetical protein